MKTNTSQRIIEYITEKGQASPSELVDYLEISSRAVFKQLKKLLENGQILKIGKAPKVYYRVNGVRDAKGWVETQDIDLSENTHKTIEDNFITITPDGQYLEGVEGFKYWCEMRQYDIQKKALEYSKIYRKYESVRREGLIDGMKKVKGTFAQVHLDEVYYLDFYSIEVFGRTKLGQKLLYAKQSQNKKMIKDLVEEIQPQIQRIIRKEKIETVLFVPPTVKREVQFMRELEKTLNLSLKSISIIKIKTPIIIPQKTLNKLEERVQNAMKTFVVDDNKMHKNVLIIDDAVGSGATMNEIARMIKERKIVEGKIIGLAITGSLKGFDVISEV